MGMGARLLEECGQKRAEKQTLGHLVIYRPDTGRRGRREPEGAAVRSLLWVSARQEVFQRESGSAVPDAGKRLR